MNKAYMDGAAKAAMFLAMIFALTSQAIAQTWQSPGKTAVIPVVVTNSTCSSSTDTVGITADRSTLLTCQSGIWSRQAGERTRLAGILGLNASFWPDYIRCDGDGTSRIFYLSTRDNANSVQYRHEHNGDAGPYTLYYTANGSYIDVTGFAGNCRMQSIANLRVSGQAYP